MQRRLKLFRGAWYVVWTEAGQTRRAALRTKDRAVAEQRYADLTTIPTGQTVGEIATSYLDDLDQRAARPDRAHTAWKALEPAFAALRPDQITRGRCRAYAEARRRAGRAPGTIRKELGVLRALLRWADPQTPAVIELPVGSPPLERYLTQDEYRRLVGACRAFHLRLFVILALATAARTQALLDLTWAQVDFRRGLIKLSGEGRRRKGRATVPMNDIARAALLEAREGARTSYVIEYADRPVGSIKHGFATACKRARLDGVTPHTIRRTAAVWMAEDGISMAAIAAYLGHSDSRTTERVYAKYGPEYLRRASRALEG